MRKACSSSSRSSSSGNGGGGGGIRQELMLKSLSSKLKQKAKKQEVEERYYGKVYKLPSGEGELLFPPDEVGQVEVEISSSSSSSSPKSSSRYIIIFSLSKSSSKKSHPFSSFPPSHAHIRTHTHIINPSDHHQPHISTRVWTNFSTEEVQ